MIRFRIATAADAQALSALAIETYSEAFGESMSAQDLAAHLAQHLQPEQITQMLRQDTFIVAESGAELVGFVQFGALQPAEEGQEIRRLYVHSSYQNQGIGSRLLETALSAPALRHAERIVLDVWERNHGARRLYERFGFRVIGERPFTVASGAETSPDLIMVRQRERQADNDAAL